MKGKVLTAAAIKDAYAGIVKEKKVEHSLLWVVNQHNIIIQKVLKNGTMKNYRKVLESFSSVATHLDLLQSGDPEFYKPLSA